MKLGTVIGRVTLSKALPQLVGARWLIVSPHRQEDFARGLAAAPRVGPDPSPVVYDNLGGGVGQTIGYVEGREAARPFAVFPPIDAISVALVDECFYQPFRPEPALGGGDL